MAVQQQNSSFARKHGARVAQANTECMGKPIDTGNRRLPGGINDGVARLSAMYTKEQETDGCKTPKGEVFFRASAIVALPVAVNGETTEGLVTSVVIPLCDVPAKGQRKAESFVANYKAMRDLIMSLGIPECPETTQTDPTGQRTEAYWFAAMQGLTDPARAKTNPVYISFSTRLWQPPLPPGSPPGTPLPAPMVFETWHGLASPQKVAQLTTYDPAAGVKDNGMVRDESVPPHPSPDGLPVGRQPTADVAVVENNGMNLEDEVAYCLGAASEDPNCETDEGFRAARRLEELAQANGWTKEQTSGADNWEQVAEMALTPPTDEDDGTEAVRSVEVGSKWKFCKRNKDGAKLTNKEGTVLPPIDVEVATMDQDAKTCTVRDKNGKDVVDLRSKKPVVVKFDWLE